MNGTTRSSGPLGHPDEDALLFEGYSFYGDEDLDTLFPLSNHHAVTHSHLHDRPQLPMQMSNPALPAGMDMAYLQHRAKQLPDFALQDWDMSGLVYNSASSQISCFNGPMNLHNMRDPALFEYAPHADEESSESSRHTIGNMVKDFINVEDDKVPLPMRGADEHMGTARRDPLNGAQDVGMRSVDMNGEFEDTSVDPTLDYIDFNEDTENGVQTSVATRSERLSPQEDVNVTMVSLSTSPSAPASPGRVSPEYLVHITAEAAASPKSDGSGPKPASMPLVPLPRPNVRAGLELDKADLDDITVEQCKRLLRAHGQKAVGKKGDLVSRIRELKRTRQNGLLGEVG